MSKIKHLDNSFSDIYLQYQNVDKKSNTRHWIIQTREVLSTLPMHLYCHKRPGYVLEQEDQCKSKEIKWGTEYPLTQNIFCILLKFHFHKPLKIRFLLVFDVVWIPGFVNVVILLPPIEQSYAWSQDY